MSNTLLGHPITAGTGGTLAKIGIIVKSLPGTGTVNVKMGVYLNGSRLTAIEGPVKVGSNEFTPATPIQLVSGNVYWVVAVFSVDLVYVGETSDGGALRWTTPFIYGNDLSGSLSFSPATFGKQSNYYLLVSP